jgi:hypothetical protein
LPDVAGYLAAKGLALKPADARNVHTACIFCDEPPEARGRLYINIDPDAEIPGLFFCHRCQRKGSLGALKLALGDTATETDTDHETRSAILTFAADFYHDELFDKFFSVFRYLRGPQRGLSPDTLRSQKIGYAAMPTTDKRVLQPRTLYSALRGEGFDTDAILGSGVCRKDERRNTIVDALAGMVTIPYLTAGQVVALRGRTWPYTPEDFAEFDGPTYTPPSGKYKTISGTSTRLFNTDAFWNTDEVFLTEGEFDALILNQHGYPAVGVPGANAWQDAWDNYLSTIKRVWLVFDRDAAGERAATKLADRFGGKIRRLHLSEEGVKCDPTQWFVGEGHTPAEFDELLVAGRRGGILVTVEEAIGEFTEIQALPGLKFGWDQLDDKILPGLQPSQLMIVLAKTGTGKTILLLNLMHRVRMIPGQRDMKILFVSLEQTRGEWWDRARRIHRFYNLDATEADAADFWRNHIRLIDRNRLTEADLRQALDDYAYETGAMPDLMCLDYLGYFARSYRGEAYQRTSDAVMAIKGICKEYRIACITPQQVSRMGVDGQEIDPAAARDSGVIEETADFLLTMWSPDNAMGRAESERQGLIQARIGKSRHGGRGSLLSMQFAPVSLVMVPEPDLLCARARKEYRWRQDYTDDWARVVHRHRTGEEGHLEEMPDGTFVPGRRRHEPPGWEFS